MISDMDRLEDYIAEVLCSENYYDLLSSKLDSMPRTRDGAEEILSSIVSYDEPTLFIVLLQEYEQVLTHQEIVEIRRQFSERFDLPLSAYGLE